LRFVGGGRAVMVVMIVICVLSARMKWRENMLV